MEARRPTLEGIMKKAIDDIEIVSGKGTEGGKLFYETLVEITALLGMVNDVQNRQRELMASICARTEESVTQLNFGQAAALLKLKKIVQGLQVNFEPKQ